MAHTELEAQLGAIVSAAPVVIQETKSGWRTTEFWGSIAALLVPLLAGVPEKFLIPLTGAVAAAYAISRGLAKNGAPAAVTPAP